MGHHFQGLVAHGQGRNIDAQGRNVDDHIPRPWKIIYKSVQCIMNRPTFVTYPDSPQLLPPRPLICNYALALNLDLIPGLCCPKVDRVPSLVTTLSVPKASDQERHTSSAKVLCLLRPRLNKLLPLLEALWMELIGRMKEQINTPSAIHMLVSCFLGLC